MTPVKKNTHPLLCDLNCDMGEGMSNDEALMPFITSANIACGYHAGDEATMRHTLLLANKFGVHVGAHPSFPDRDNFGRTEMDSSPQQVYGWVREQLHIIAKIADENGVMLHHVKPHGALYNLAARDPQTAQAIAQAVRDFNPQLVLYGLSGSYIIKEGKAAGLKTASEVFADRTYQDDGSLTPRSLPHALIEKEEMAIKQVLQMVHQGRVTSISGKEIPIVAETICLHSDGKQALAFARKIFVMLQKQDE